MKIRTVLEHSINLWIGLLVVRLFLGLRISAGALKRFIDTDLLDDFESRLAEKNIDPVLGGVIFGVLMICSISLITGWKMKWFCWGFIGVSIFILASFSAEEYFDLYMPPLVTTTIASLFAFIPARRFNVRSNPAEEIQPD